MVAVFMKLLFDIWVKWHTISPQYRLVLHYQSYRPSKRLTIAHLVWYLAALCGSHLVTHQFPKALMLEGNPNIPIQSQTTCRHDHSCKCDVYHRINKANYIIDLPSTLSHSFSLYCWKWSLRTFSTVFTLNMTKILPMIDCSLSITRFVT